MELTPEASAARPQFSAYCRQHGLQYYRDWGLPEATQFLRHGDMLVVPNAGNGTLEGGVEGGWLAHVGAIDGGSKIRISTVVLAPVAASVGFAERVLCHDRDLSERDASNPAADAQVVELDDRLVQLESERFLHRYKLSTDHDQDQLRVWQLFSPAFIHWLTDDAPSDFSFELQDGALCCFVPGVLADADHLDRLCRAAARVLARVEELALGAPSTVAAAPGSRDQIVEAELAKHPFAAPPKSVRAAARKFGFWPLPGPRAWRLGNEAFFRAYAAAIGLRPLDVSDFHASHYDAPVPGDITQVATGRLDGIDYDAYLILTKDESFGWAAVLVDVGDEINNYAFANLPETDAAKARGIEITGAADNVVVFWADGGPRKRTRERLDQFLAGARKLIAATIDAGTFRT
jgi:hypothetical protein